MLGKGSERRNFLGGGRSDLLRQMTGGGPNQSTISWAHGEDRGFVTGRDMSKRGLWESLGAMVIWLAVSKFGVGGAFSRRGYLGCVAFYWIGMEVMRGI